MAHDLIEVLEVEDVVQVRYILRYELDGVEREVQIDSHGVARPIDAAQELGVETVRGTYVRRVRVRPTCDLTVTHIEAELACDVKMADAILLNGYNSWTDTQERPVKGRMYGLSRAPKAVVERWVLDGSGDYRFTPQDTRPGYQHGFGFGYLRYGDEVLLVGSLDESSGFTTIFEDFSLNVLRLEKEPPQGVLTAGACYELMGFALCRGGLDDAVQRWLTLADITPRPASALVGFSSWYRHYGDITHDKLVSDLEAVDKLLHAVDLGSCTPVFQIDDGYAKVGDWLTFDEGRFPHGMAWFAQQCEERGLLPGLWLAPLVCEQESELCRTHPDWVMHDEQGEPIAAGSNWSGYFPLDTRKDEVREYLRTVLWTVTHDWGFKLLKLDFLFAACMVPHDGLNRGQLMADALDLLRSAVPEDVSFDLCGVPLCSALGRTEYCRIGCDVGLDWDDKPYMRLLHRERVSTKNSLANTRGRAYLDGKAFRNDPDVFFLRCDVKLSAAQRRDLLSADSSLGGMLLTSDDVATWDADQRLAFELALSVFTGRTINQ